MDDRLEQELGGEMWVKINGWGEFWGQGTRRGDKGEVVATLKLLCHFRGARMATRGQKGLEKNY